MFWGCIERSCLKLLHFPLVCSFSLGLVQLVIQLYCKAKQGMCLKYCKELCHFVFFFFKLNQFCIQNNLQNSWHYSMNAMQAQLRGNRQSPEAFPGAWQAPRLFCDTSNREGRTCWSQDLVVISAMKLLQVSCWSQARGRPFLKLWIMYALGIYFTVGLMLSKGLLPLKRIVLFLAMSLPVQCMSFLWSWSSVR